jgi:hypothetical protein
VTDLAYQARGRRYCDEDIFLSSRLRAQFDIELCHPRDAVALMDTFNAVVVRNSGPVLHYQQEHDSFCELAAIRGIRVYNPLTGRGDMATKQYLLDLTEAGYPVIPTIDRLQDVDRLPDSSLYAIKPKAGADSIGLHFVSKDDLGRQTYDGVLVQPRINFSYEVSFYYIDHTFQYALYAPEPEHRWILEAYEPTEADLVFAQRFIDWNTIDHGIQRVDACRTPEGDLLLVELEDLNPYLSLGNVTDETRDAFVTNMTDSLHRFLSTPTHQ